MLNIKNVTRLIGLVVCILPVFAMADGWDTTLVTTGRTIRIGMYTVAGTCGLITIVWSGGQWMFARATGDHSHSFMDYVKQIAVVGCVGAGIGLGAWAWQIFGTGNPT
jgi:type IV secretory pathway VirB2 component (pilin)